MTTEFKNILLDKHGRNNYKALVSFIEDSNINIVNQHLNGAAGFAALNTIYLDFDLIDSHQQDDVLFHIILHEIGHYKRIQKMGKEKLFELLSLSDFEDFCAAVIKEEIFADRYGCAMFYHFNKAVYNRGYTQQLELKSRQNLYKEIAVHLFGVVENNEESYNKLVGKFTN